VVSKTYSVVMTYYTTLSDLIGLYLGFENHIDVPLRFY